jgi:tetratricopeptide (TPR) repeat protein
VAIPVPATGSPPDGLLNDLGLELRERYARTGELPDLEGAIHNFERAVELTPAGSPILPMYLGNLGNGLRERYARTGELPDLEKAIYNFERAVELTPASSPNLPRLLGNLGNGLRERYARTGELPDLEKAIYNFERAVELTPAGSRDLPGHLSNLGSGLWKRYGHTRELPDLEKVILNFQQALEIDREIGNRLGEANQLANLGIVYAERGDLDKAKDYLQQAQAIYQQIGAGGEGPEIVRQALEELERQQQERGE